MSELAGRGAAWTEERGTSDEGRRRLRRPASSREAQWEAAPDARLPVPDAVEFLRGRWRVERHLADHVTGTIGTFDGAAVFAVSGPATLAYHEQGELRFGTYQGEASRRLVYRGRPDGTADVSFADGRDFYHLDPRPGHWQGQHPCGRDHYTLAAERVGAGTFRERWQVRGPGKDYEISTILTRAGPGTDG